MKPLKSAMIAGGLAVIATIFCILCIMGGGFFFCGRLAPICAWLMTPAFSIAGKVDSTLLFWVTGFSIGCFQFFIPAWIILRLRYGKHAA
jgi:hypothetical protein